MKRARQPRPTVRTRTHWRGFVDLALSCVADAEAALADDQVAINGFSTMDRRRMDLSRRCGLATTEQLEREAGAVLGDVARALIQIGRAWSRAETPGAVRADLTPMLKAVAVYLDARLHDLATSDFERAHAGRPEVA